MGKAKRTQAKRTQLRTVELFAGIGGFRLAADSLGLRTVWANDLCPLACDVYRDRFGTGEMAQGDLREHLEEIPPHDLLTAGFPCQPFSSAGKKKGIRDPRGTLFEVLAQVLERHQPRFFVLENVKRLLSMERGRHFATILDVLTSLPYTIEWRLLNARDIGLPQNRQRVFLIGVESREPEVESPGSFRLATQEDLGVWNIGDSDRWKEILTKSQKPKAKSLLSFPFWGLAKAGRYHAQDPVRFSQAGPPVSLRSVLEKKVDPRFDFTESTLQWISDNTEVNRFVDGVQILSNQSGGARMGYTIFGTEGLAPTLTSTTSRHYERYRINGRYRRLTNVEYARIQGFSDDHCRSATIYDQYALFGNAVPPAMAEWVMAKLLDGTVKSARIRRSKICMS